MSVPEGTRLYLSGIPDGLRKEELSEHFKEYNRDITDMWIARNPGGFAFVRVRGSREYVDEFIGKFANTDLKGSTLSLEVARNQGGPQKRFRDDGGPPRREGRYGGPPDDRRPPPGDRRYPDPRYDAHRPDERRYDDRRYDDRRYDDRRYDEPRYGEGRPPRGPGPYDAHRGEPRY